MEKQLKWQLRGLFSLAKTYQDKMDDINDAVVELIKHIDDDDIPLWNWDCKIEGLISCLEQIEKAER